MALSVDWKYRVDHWEKALWRAVYRPLGKVEFSGFTTLEQLTPGEALTRSFEPMPEGTPWGAKWEYAWLKTSVTIPPEAQGKRVVIRFKPSKEESLVWINGEAVGSFGWGHKEVTLSTEAQAGAVYDILMETYAGHGVITVGEGPYEIDYEPVPDDPGPTQTSIQESTFGIWREEIYQAAIDYSTLYQLREQLDPLSLRTSQIDECLMDTTLIIDPELPEAELLETICAGRERMRPLLECKNGPTMPTLYAFGHAHIDIAWLWPLQHTERKMAMTVLNQLSLFDEYPEHRFLQSQPHLYWMLKQRYPEIYARFKAAVQAGKVIADGGMWVEADTNLSGGEALIRQILYGRAFFRDELGVDSRVLWLPDVFGYSGALPQILSGAGMTGFATQKITWAYNGGEPFPYNNFWWEGIDGTAIPAHIFTDYNSEMRPHNLVERWNTRLQKNGVNALFQAFGWGDGGGGPTRDHLEYFRRVEDLEGLPRVKMSSPEAFFADLLAQGLVKERYVGELYFQAHRGTYTSQAKTKRGNRKGEIALREAELWASAARLLHGFDFHADTLEAAWRKQMLNQFHDILPGSSIQRVYQEAEAAYEEILAEANGLAATASTALAGAGSRQVVFNSLSWPRTALVETAAGAVEVAIPAMGWTALPEVPAAIDGAQAQATLHGADGFTLENDLLVARFDRQGQLASLWDKASQRQVLDGTGNRLRLFKDVPNKWDAWDIDQFAEMQPVETPEAADFSIETAGGLVARVRVTRKLSQSTVSQVVSLRRGSRRIDFDTVIDWQERHKLLKVSFPAAIHANEAISEIQFGHVRRPNHASRKYDADRFEICNHKWSALAEEGRGVAVLNDSKYGLSVKGNSINLTLLKSALAPDMHADKGIQRFTYAVYYWNGSLLDSGVVQEAYDLNVPVQLTHGATSQPVSLFSLDAPNVIIEAVKLAEDGSGDVIVRLYEAMRTATRCTLTVNLPVRAASQTNLLEEHQTELVYADGRVALNLRPFEIKTVRLHV